jgi:HSP20 family protein
LVYSEKKDKKEEKEKGKVVRSEFRYSSFQRSFALPKDIDVNAIQASHRNGILVIELPKKIEQKDSSVRQIEIQ